MYITFNTEISLSTLLMRVSDPTPSFLISFIATFYNYNNYFLEGKKCW